MELARAIALHRQGALREAAVAYVDVLRTRPDHPDALRLLAMALLGLGHADEALGTLDRALANDRRNPTLLANRAQILEASGRWDEAADALARAVRAAPRLAEAWSALGRVERARGRPVEAARAFASAVVAEPTRAAGVAFADALAVLPDPPTDVVDALLATYALDGVDHALLDRTVARVLAPLAHDPSALARHPLALAWLAHGSVPADLEPAVVRLRAHLLDAVRAGAAPLAALEAVVLAAWASEYAWAPVGAEGLAAMGDSPAGTLARAMYGPPGPGPLPPDAERVLRTEPAAERRYAAETEAFGTTSDAALQAMYEDHPYPRRVTVQVREPVPFARWWAQVLPAAAPVAAPDRIDVLVAGCGTGRHALTSATSWCARVTAIDLSRASLGRAARRARELGVDPIRFLVADLRELAGWADRFHVVESVGVLHHLPDWVAGLRVLRGLLRPGGRMRLGLYAERARQDVVAARAFVAERAFPATDAGIRAARAALMALPDGHPARGVTTSVDFGSLSGCRDLVFHVREHRVTLPEVEAGLRACGLRFVGFQHVNPAVPAAYRARWPDDDAQDDLARWDTLEQDHPRAFAGMYVFWVRPVEQGEE